MMTKGEHNWIPFKKYAFYDEKVFNFKLLLVRKEALEAGRCGATFLDRRTRRTIYFHFEFKLNKIWNDGVCTFT